MFFTSVVLPLAALALFAFVAFRWYSVQQEVNADRRVLNNPNLPSSHNYVLPTPLFRP